MTRDRDRFLERELKGTYGFGFWGRYRKGHGFFRRMKEFCLCEVLFYFLGIDGPINN